MTQHRIPRRALAASVAVAALAAAAPLATAGPAAAAGPKVVCTSGKAGLAAKLTKDITAALKKMPSRSAVALQDPATKTTCSYNGDARFDSASVIKATILGTLLWDANTHGRQLTAWEKQQAKGMITISDNPSTTRLWERLGSSKVKAFVKAAGMKRTVPETGHAWGISQITANDEQKMLALFTQRNKLIRDKDRSYALDLMNKVVSGQRWGTPAGAPKGTKIHVKNGWMHRTNDNRWYVHSIGAFDGGGRTYTMSVLTYGTYSDASGAKAIEAVARVVHKDLNPSAKKSALFVPPARPQEVVPPGV
ncbi:serine hydrolase [Streptomyces huiliensis]|uniref:serine hydrolase n=1 Tax=Streptomyces huiliensis TaxID=2876027 RepID=UPI001CBFDC57|nr:serine hydrolase [Streptomyces huiliensis]MBZ4320730.1 class A beta-lactamase-related serine hydrolase [Streptomyces huiliensis]